MSRTATLALAASLFASGVAHAASVGGTGQAGVAPGAFPAMTAIYAVSGVVDSGGGAAAGVATVFHCSNLSGATRMIQIVVLKDDGVIAGNKTFTLLKNTTWTASTHETSVYSDDVVISPGTTILQGLAVISATDSHIVCTAQAIDAAAASPVGIDLHLIRFNAWPGSQE